MMRWLIVLSLLGAAARQGCAQVPAAPAAKPGPVGLEWAHDWKSACERAGLEKKLILVFVVADTEAICQKFLDGVTSDAAAMRKLASFVPVVSSPSAHELIDVERDGQKTKSCARYRGILCSEHQAIELALRDHFFDPALGGVVIPQFAVFDADGKLLIKHEYAMKRDAFLEFLDKGLAAGGDPAAVQRIVDSILGARTGEEREKAAKRLFAAFSPVRQKALHELLARLETPAAKAVVIRVAGAPERKAWAPALAALLADPERLVRISAVVTLEEERNPAVVGELLAAWEKEQDAEIRKDLLRALGPCGGGNAEAKKLLLEELGSTEESHRVAAALSLGSFLKDGDDVAAALQSRWSKETSPKVRTAIVWGIGESEDERQSALLDELMKEQKEADLVQLAGVAKARLRSNLKAAVKTLGKDGDTTIRRLLGPIYDKDEVVRRVVRELNEGAARH